MKTLAVAALFVVCLALPGSSFAQNTVKLLDPVNIAATPVNFPTFDLAVPFASKQLYLQCGEGATGQIEGPFAGNSLIVDNYIQVQSPDNSIQNYCPNVETLGCFTLNIGDDPALYTGQPAESIYGPVSPQDVSGSLQPGLGLYTFSLMDWSYTYGSSEVSLRTTCAIKDKVCHYDNGKKGYKTLTLGAAAMPAHLNHHPNDYLGACTNGR